MNLSSQSVKGASKALSEDFYLDIETPRGHFFAVLDFASHDYANLNATLKGKLETIVGSFVSLSRFSADLFLGFLAKEINNFLYNLREQAGGPELLCSAALCLVSGNRLSYFLCGDVGISIHNAGRVLPLQPAQPDAADKQLDKLGARNLDVPLTDNVQAFTLQDADVVLIMTQALEEAFETPQLSSQLGSLGSSDPELICETLMKASASAPGDRTLVVIAGPYERYVEPVLTDLSKAVASLEARLNALGDSGQEQVTSVGPETDSQLELKLTRQIEMLREETGGKAAKIDLLELEEKMKNFVVLLESKADTAAVLSLQSDVLKMGLVADAVSLQSQNSESTPTSLTGGGSAATPASTAEGSAGSEDAAKSTLAANTWRKWERYFLLRVAALVVLLGFAGAFAGTWLQSRLMRRPAVTTISPTVAPVQTPVNIPANQPTVTQAEKPANAVTEIAVKPGDSLKKLAQQYNVPPEKLMELNPGITRWPMIRPGQRILVPSRLAVTPVPSPPTN